MREIVRASLNVILQELENTFSDFESSIWTRGEKIRFGSGLLIRVPSLDFRRQFKVSKIARQRASSEKNYFERNRHLQQRHFAWSNICWAKSTSMFIFFTHLMRAQKTANPPARPYAVRGTFKYKLNFTHTPSPIKIYEKHLLVLLHRVWVVRPTVGGGGGGTGGGGGGEFAVGGTLQLELLNKGGDLEILLLCGDSNGTLLLFCLPERWIRWIDPCCGGQRWTGTLFF